MPTFILPLKVGLMHTFLSVHRLDGDADIAAMTVEGDESRFYSRDFC